MRTVTFPNDDYQVVWPRDILRDELLSLVTSQQSQDWSDRAELILEEAFWSQAAADDFRALGKRGFGSVENHCHQQQRNFIESILERVDTLPLPTASVPYWSERQAQRTRSSTLTPLETAEAYIRHIDTLAARGYFAESFGQDCVDADSHDLSDPQDVLRAVLGREYQWPLDSAQLAGDRDLFFDLIEGMHDLVARPRRRWYHFFDNCGWHYQDFSRISGRRLYRFGVNKLLERTGFNLHLANDGVDQGRLVSQTDQARADLLHVSAARPSSTADDVRHAIALFRGRTTSMLDKRSAVIALAGVLEGRRELLKVSTFRGDERALFEIANRFAIRHQNEGQMRDYGESFLDWIFWWYLATIELTESLLSRG